jgi:hypothetical protein
MRHWSTDELTVLLALFVSQPFSAGDDSTATCASFAREMGRPPSAIDRQWRNIRFHLWRLDQYGYTDHIGDRLIQVVDKYRDNLVPLRNDAIQIMRNHRWHLRRFLK